MRQGTIKKAENLRFAKAQFFLVASFFFLHCGVVRAQDPHIAIAPDTIDFGRVRIGHRKDSSFAIHYTSISSIQHLILISPGADHLSDPDFQADNISSPDDTLSPLHPSDTDLIHFLPIRSGPILGFDTIAWSDTSALFFRPLLVLKGIGTAPNVVSNGNTFGDLRVGDSSSFDTLHIVNLGNDTTAVDSVSIVDSSALINFAVQLDSLPTSGGYIAPLGYGLEQGDSILSFLVRFQPQAIGSDSLVIRIHTVDGSVIFDTVIGRGVEPLVLVTPRIIDLGTITVQKNSSPDSMIDTIFAISDSGTFPGVLDTVLHTDTSGHFTVTIAPNTFPQSLAINHSIVGSVQFYITEEGDFSDTISVLSDARDTLFPGYHNYRPAVILRAKVRTGPIGDFYRSFDTVSTCDTVRDALTITNPYPIEIHIDTIALVADSAGFDYNQQTFIHQVSMPPFGSYTFQLSYSFPPDSLNGLQVLKMALYQRTLGNETPIVDTIFDSVYRKQQVLSLKPVLPANPSSATDVNEMRLPIMIEGPRNGVRELDGWTLYLTFSNDLFEPTSVDTTGSLSVSGDSGYLLSTYWDQPNRKYTIHANGTAVSDSIMFPKNLLLSLLLQPYLTKDTVVTVTTRFSWDKHPCAYNLQSFTLAIPYADDCGNATIRAFLNHENPLLSIIGTWPNPISSGNSVSIHYHVAESSEIYCRSFNAEGDLLGEIETSVNVGNGTIDLPRTLLPASGMAFVRLQAVDSNGGQIANQTCKVIVIP